MLYLDYCATTPLDDEVLRTITDVMKQYYGNPSSIHRKGVEAEKLIIRAREIVAEALQCRPKEIIFTSCGTESNNLAVKGAALNYRKRGNHIITSQIEHASVYESCKELEAMGFRVTYLPVNAAGRVSIEDVQAAIADDTILVSLMHVNNEVGTIQPIAQVGKLLSAFPRIIFHVDAIQSIGKLKLVPEQLHVDLLSVSAHKIRGPKGAGFLYRREGVELKPILVGGGQEFGVRSGTENVPLIVGMAKAVRLAVERQEVHNAQLYELRQKLINGISEIEGLLINGSEEMSHMAPQVVHFSFPGMKSEVVVHALEQDEIFISTRSACASGEADPSRVLVAMGCDNARATSGLRVSYSADQTFADIDYFIERLKRVIAQLSPHKKMTFPR